MKKVYSFLILCWMIIGAVQAQTVLFTEDFNDCSLPSGWSTNVVGSGPATWSVGLPNNPNSNGSSIDGSCMLIMDDDAAGNNTPGYVLQFVSPTFDGTQFPDLQLSMDVHFRAIDGTSLKIMIYDGTSFHTIKEYNDDNGTGTQFSEFENFPGQNNSPF